MGFGTLMRIGVIGAGPAGLTAARELVGQVETLVLEQDPTMVGGISRTVEYKGYRFDIGGHRLFSKNADVEQYWQRVLGADLLSRPRMSRIFYGGKFYDYPLRAGNAFRNLGALDTARCLLDYVRARRHPTTPALTFEDWVTNQFGRRLYEMFFKTYTEKVWGIPCEEISADWAAQRIKGLNLATAVRSAIFGTRGDGPVVRTLIDEYRYPRLGPGMLWERVAQEIVERSGTLLMGQRVVGVEWEGGAGARTLLARSEDGRVSAYSVDHIISSMPIRSLIRAMGPQVPEDVARAGEALKYRDFLTVALIVDAPDLFPDNWIYIHDAAVRVGRIQNFKNWSPDMVPNSNTTCVGMEYFCFAGDSLWAASDVQLLGLAERELKQVGLLGVGRVIDGQVVRVPKAYPVYDEDYAHNVEVVRRFLTTQVPNVQLVGRNGMHRYNNQDHAMVTGMLAAQNILHPEQTYDLWAVNGDAEYLEEVSEERLVPRRVFG